VVRLSRDVPLKASCLLDLPEESLKWSFIRSHFVPPQALCRDSQSCLMHYTVQIDLEAFRFTRMQPSLHDWSGLRPVTRVASDRQKIGPLKSRAAYDQVVQQQSELQTW
jgi:hypothetical protein